MAQHPLEGIRVADFSLIVAGPYTGMLLGWLGAEVIKIESARHSRRLSLKADTLNLSKMSCTLDLTTPEGVGIAKELVQGCDVVVENFSPRTMKRFGLDYPILRGVRPDIIMVSMSAFGQTGPDHDYVGLAPGFIACTGGMHLTGYPEGVAQLPGTVSVNDLHSGMYAMLAVMTALHHRSRTGEGQYIDLAQAEVAATMVAEAVVEHTMTGRSPIRRGNGDIAMAPHGCYRCKGDDKWVSIAVATDEEWQALCKVMGHPELALEAEYADALSRWQNQDALDRLIKSWTTKYSHYEVMEILHGAGIAAGPSLNGEELLNDPHLKQRGVYITTTEPEGDPRNMQGLPWKSTGATPAYARAPSPGEHNDYMFGQLLGFPKDQIERLKESKVIY